LNKEKQPLNEEEWKEMRKHPEIGFRIAMSTTGIDAHPEYILSHHERWERVGYPQGLPGRTSRCCPAFCPSLTPMMP
jgi:response regulator RpfG family c-di-GMP phosphodiesterase